MPIGHVVQKMKSVDQWRGIAISTTNDRMVSFVARTIVMVVSLMMHMTAAMNLRLLQVSRG